MNDMVDWADVAAIAVIARKFGENRPADIMVLAFEEIAAAGIRYGYKEKRETIVAYDVGDVVCLGVINAPQMVVTDTRVVVADTSALCVEANCTWFTPAGEMHTCWFSERLLEHDLREIDFARGSDDSACAS